MLKIMLTQSTKAYPQYSGQAGRVGFIVICIIISYDMTPGFKPLSSVDASGERERKEKRAGDDEKGKERKPFSSS